MNNTIHTDRRSVLSILAAASAAPLVLPGRLFGQEAPSKKITIGCIGVGWQGGGNLKSLLNESDCRVVAVCDADEAHLQDAVNTVNRKYGNQDCKGYKDFRELIARDNIDSVAISTPDHWHAVMAITAAKQKIVGDAEAYRLMHTQILGPWALWGNPF